MEYNVLKRMIFVFAIVVFIFSLNACGTTGGAVGFGWGQEPGHGHGYDVKQAKKGGPPPHAPAHGYRAKYNYRYYPSCSVYYDTYRKLYFYLQGPNWQISASLPHAIQVSLGDHVSFGMDTDKPYTHYQEHKRKYPPGQLKKKAKHKNKWVS